MSSVYFLTLLATLMSTYLSAIETTMPPIKDGSTLVVNCKVSLPFRNFWKKNIYINSGPCT